MRKKDIITVIIIIPTPPFYNGKMDRKKEGVGDVYEILMMDVPGVCENYIVLFSSTVQ